MRFFIVCWQKKLPGFFIKQVNQRFRIIHADEIAGIAHHIVDEPVLFCFERIQETVAEKKRFDLFRGMARVFSNQVKQLRLQTFLLARGDAHVFRVTAPASARRMHVDR